jgi:hypothetical protein
MTVQSLLRFSAAITWTIALAPTALADQQSEEAASELLQKKLKNEDPQKKALLDAVKGKDIIVVAGSMDHIDQVLRAAHIRFTEIQPHEVAGYPLKQDQIVMINCPGRIPGAGLERIKKFVRAGGLLYTTDWSLANVIEKIFPRTIAHNGESTADEVAPVIVDKQSDNIMSRMLLTRKSEPQWWLEGGSYPIKILDKERVEVLAHSPMMGTKYHGAPVVVRFRWEDGEVIHVVSHFYRQVETHGPAIAAAAAAASFDGLSEKDKKEFAATPAAQAKLGDVESSYAFQRMTTNLVIGKQERNKELDRAYDHTVSGEAMLFEDSTVEGNLTSPVAEVSAGAKLKVLNRKGDKVQVRDDAGNEGWMSSRALESRK